MKTKIFIAVLVALSFLGGMVFEHSTTNKPMNVVTPVIGNGVSMEPTITGSQVTYELPVSSLSELREGDVINFVCVSQKCGAEGNHGKGLTKRITKIDNGCLTVMGDNRDHSYDSRVYGPLCGDDIVVNGIVLFRESVNPNK